MNNDTDEIRDKYLIKLYELTEGNLINKVNIKELETILGLSRDESDKIFYYLLAKNLIKQAQSNVGITDAGVNKVEKDMKESNLILILEGDFSIARYRKSKS